VTAPAVTFDGSPVLIEFGCEGINPASVAGASITLWLYQDGASIGVLGTMNNPAAGTSRAPVRPARRLTPTPGSHTYSVRATVSTGTGQILAGPGGAAQDAPAFIRITRV
jgi:hypothetical protein